MRIAIVGWGSLLWDPRDLPLAGAWQKGGPQLPLEFSRIARDSRLTLVIDYEHGVPVDTYYAVSPRDDIDKAVAELRLREGTGPKGIGFTHAKDHKSSSDEHPAHRRACKAIRAWLGTTNFDAAVWTALSSNFRRKTGRAFSVHSAVEYLTSLPQPLRERALNYVRNAPPEVDTPLRRELVALGLIES